MKDTRRKELIYRCRGFAKKNKFCLNLAAIYIVLVIVIENLFSHFKRVIITLIAAVCAAIILMYICGLGREKYTQSIQYNNFINDSVSENCESSPGVLDKAQKDKENQKTCDELIHGYNADCDWILINKLNKIPKDRNINLVYIDNRMQCDKRALNPLKDMLKAAEADEVSLAIVNAYIPVKRQEELFDRRIKEYMDYGYTYIDAYKKTATQITIPGTGEHEAGIGFDILDNDNNQPDLSFANTESYKWLCDNCYKYGFILRYPEDKEEITGIMYEPWHFRYVGEEVAKEIHERKITLEEYIWEK